MDVIEFMGLPGSGKSTLTPIVKRGLQEKGIRVYDATDIVLASRALPGRLFLQQVTEILPASMRRNVLRGMTRVFGVRREYQNKFETVYPELCAYVQARTEVATIPEAHRVMMMRWFLNLGAYYMMSQESQERAVVIFEEGFVHKVITFFIAAHRSQTDDAAVARYLELIPIPDQLLRIDADVATCQERLNGRALPRRLQGSNDNEVSNYLSRAASVLEQAGKVMARCGCRVITLDNTGDSFAAGDIRAQLADALKEVDGRTGQGRRHAL